MVTVIFFFITPTPVDFFESDMDDDGTDDHWR